jgi:hypothetical protein
LQFPKRYEERKAVASVGCSRLEATQNCLTGSPQLSQASS